MDYKLVFSLLFMLFIVSTNSEYTWNGSEWVWSETKLKSVAGMPKSSTFFIITLTCRIIVQQILLIFWEKNTYTTLLGPTRLLILRWYSTYTFIQTYTIIKF